MRGGAMEPNNQEKHRRKWLKLSPVIQIDEAKIQKHVGEPVPSNVEEMLNAMLVAEADRPPG
jgi:hypothetical protein